MFFPASRDLFLVSLSPEFRNSELCTILSDRMLQTSPFVWTGKCMFSLDAGKLALAMHSSQRR